MVKRMLIDATHPEETRVVVISGTRLEELDVETSTKRQLKGNIYLAKVVRVEPSLQAAFVDYGGNRHGFLAFSEIHPDYYQIPVADRQALLAEERESLKRDTNGEAHGHGEGGDEDSVDMVGGDDEEVERRRPRPLRHYKIQEVVKRRQILLVQVVKEERGNKGAALTTYLSLAGRYCVLMPNTARGGGVSRKITNAPDRKRLKSIANELDIPERMAVIIRTAGSERSKAEIKRDYEYLLRLWMNIVEVTKQSIAPALVHEEANLIKRSIRDLYSRDLEELLVEGEDGYRAAKDFMRMLTPSHAKKVKPYRDPTMPLFYRYQVETQLDAMHSPVVQLKSGGYVVINQTEALVAIDVNSGRATKERHIEETALKTNVEAADEIARQLRLRDLAGLIVIDFIDMEESRNNHAVERRLKDAMKADRARIQLGKISPFGLLELSRQRLRPSLMETSFQPCPHCAGAGTIRSVESTAVYILRAIEEEGIRHRSSEVTMTVPTAVALYILNFKRAALAEIEIRYGLRVVIQGDDALVQPNYRLDRVKSELRPDESPLRPVVVEPPAAEDEEEEEEEAEKEEEEEAAQPAAVAKVEKAEKPPKSEMAEKAEKVEKLEKADAGAEDEPRRRRRRRKRRRRGDERPAGAPQLAETAELETAGGPEQAGTDEAGMDEAEEVGAAEEAASTEAAEGDLTAADEAGKARRRGRRGGRRRHREAAETAVEAPSLPEGEVLPLAEPVPAPAWGPAYEFEAPAETLAVAEAALEIGFDETAPAPAMEEPLPTQATAEAAPAKAKRPRRKKEAAPVAAPAAPAKPKRVGRAKPTAIELAAVEPKATKPKVTKPKVTKPRTAKPAGPAAATRPEPDLTAPEAEAVELAAEPAATPAAVPAEPIAAPMAPAAPAAAEAGESPAAEVGGQPRRRGWWNRPSS